MANTSLRSCATTLLVLFAIGPLNAQTTNGKAALLTEIEIEAAREDETSEESGSYVQKNSDSATKHNRPLRQTPQSVSVVGHKQMQTFGLDDAYWDYQEGC